MLRLERGFRTGSNPLADGSFGANWHMIVPHAPKGRQEDSLIASGFVILALSPVAHPTYKRIRLARRVQK